MVLIKLLVGLFAVITLSLALVASPATFSGYDIGVMSFTGIFGGYKVNLNGSAQEILSKMNNIHPDWRTSITTTNATAAQVRSADAKDGLICYPVPGQDWQPAQWAGITDGIRALQSINGCCGVGARTCVRIACESSDAIWYCNDEYQPICSTCAYLASYAQDLVNDCSFWDGIYLQLGGQEFDSDSYNIIVRYDDYECPDLG